MEQADPHEPRPSSPSFCCLLLLLLLLLCPAMGGFGGGGTKGTGNEIRFNTGPQQETLGDQGGRRGGGHAHGDLHYAQGREEEEEHVPSITWGRANTLLAHFGDAPTNVTVIVGHRATLPCIVHNLAGKDVSWIRQRDLHILTVGIFTYTSDDRFKVRHSPGSEGWSLEISPVIFRDAGVYECQVSTAPKISLPVTLNVAVQQARIEGPEEVYIQKGSTVRFTCRLNTHPDNVGTVSWFRDTYHLDYDSARGGVSVEVERTPTSTTSKLFLTGARAGDGGNYTCRPQHAAPATVRLHVVNGEESAAVHTAGASRLRPPAGTLLHSCFLVGVGVLLLVSGPR